MKQSIRFQGQWEDEETGLYYNRYRYYDASQGRYITQDPIGLAGGLNGYAYVGNPTGWVDPLGLEAWVIVTPSGNGYSFYAHGSSYSGVITGSFNQNTTNFNQLRPSDL